MKKQLFFRCFVPRKYYINKIVNRATNIDNDTRESKNYR